MNTFGKLINGTPECKICYLVNFGQSDSAYLHIVLALHKLWTIDNGEVDSFGGENVP